MSSSSTPSDPSALPGDTAADPLGPQDQPGVAEAFAAGQPHEAVPESEEAAGDDTATMLLPEAAGAEAEVEASAEAGSGADDASDVPADSQAGAAEGAEHAANGGESASADDGQPATDAAKPAAPAIPDMNPAACAAELRKRFPALFSGATKPLKLRIQQDIQERAPGVFSKQTLTGFFRRHTRSTPYLMALSKATHRFDLDGQQAGELSEEHRVAATEELTRRRASQDARRAEEQAQHAAAHAAEQARRAETEAAQRQRASLLRDFQATTLTLANFCALKGVAPEALEPMLAQARAEAEERAKNPPPMHRPHVDGRANPRNDGRGDGRNDGRGDGRNDGRRDNRGGPRDGANVGAPNRPAGSGGAPRQAGAGGPGDGRSAPGGESRGGPRQGPNAGSPRQGANAGGPRNGPPGGGRRDERGPRNAGAPNGGHRNGLTAPRPSSATTEARPDRGPQRAAHAVGVDTQRAASTDDSATQSPAVVTSEPADAGKVEVKDSN